jgi:hypothetical protein
MSQMTGRKDIPHIYLTYAPSVVADERVPEGWPQEREELLEKIRKAPGFRVNHILEDIDRQVNELQIVAEAVTEFIRRADKIFWKFANITTVIALLLFLFGDVLLNAVLAFPENTLVASIRNGQFSLMQLIIPAILGGGTLIIGFLSYNRIAFPKIKKKALANGIELVKMDSEYRRNLWRKMGDKVRENIATLTFADLWRGYSRSLAKIQTFLNVDLKKYYERIVS